MSRGDRFDRAGFESRYARASMPPAAEIERTWPIAAGDLVRIGQSILGDRDGTGRPHKGIDLFAAAGTQVRAAIAGRVLRVVDGRRSGGSSRRQAGLFVDVLGVDDKVYRYLHLAATRSPERVHMPGEGDPDQRKEGNRVLDNLSFVLVRFQPPWCQGEALSPSLRLILNG